MKRYLPEGELLGTPENREYLASQKDLERAIEENAIVEGVVTLCDSDLQLYVDLNGRIKGILPPEEAVFCRPGESRKDIALITRVGKPVAVRVKSLEPRNGEPIAILSRREAQEECFREFLLRKRVGDILFARVTHLEPFGAFLDVGCGISSLLSVDCISVSRISHPRDRISVGDRIPVVIKTLDRESGRIFMTMRELLGTWEENASRFEVGQTVTGILRSVEPYGAFVELTPNLAGLSEIREHSAEELKTHIGERVAVYIKSINPERMKIKLILIDFCEDGKKIAPPVYFVNPDETPHLSFWQYSPFESQKLVETRFDEPV